MSKDKHKARDRRWRILRWVGEGRILSPRTGGKGWVKPLRPFDSPHAGDKDVRNLIAAGVLRLERRGRHRNKRTWVVPASNS